LLIADYWCPGDGIMFDIGWGELIVIGIVALIAIGPKELPGALRSLGHWMGKVRRMAADFQNQFNEAMREAEMADLKKQVETLTSGFDPIETARKEIEGAVEEKPPSALATSAEPASSGTETPSAFAGAAEPSVAPDLNAAPEAPAAAEPEKAVAADAPAADVPGDAKPGDRPA
jgi:sec-independent protein translocase protein TatB